MRPRSSSPCRAAAVVTLTPHSNRDPTASAVAAPEAMRLAADWGQPSMLPVPDAILAAMFGPSTSSSSAHSRALFLGTAHGRVICYGVSVITGGGSVELTLQRSLQCSPDPSQLLCALLFPTSHNSRRTSRVTRHTSHVTRHTGTACTYCQHPMTPLSSWSHQVQNQISFEFHLQSPSFNRLNAAFKP